VAEKPGVPAADAYLARQAIFDRSLSVYGYELFFRSGVENAFGTADADRASSRVIESALNTFGCGRLAAGRRIFVNVTRPMLTESIVALLPPKSTVLELQSSVAADADVVAVCRSLRKQGFLIALDDVDAARAEGPLAAQADVLKVDFQNVPLDQRRALVRKHGRPGMTLLAKRLGMRKELTEAMELGYTLFQGYFFCRPEMVTQKEAPAYKLNYLRFLKEVNAPEVDFDALERIIRQDLTLSIKLLRYINSALVGLRSRVDSIKQAITLMGLTTVRRWASLLAMAAMSEDKPPELVVTSLARARFCEQAGLKSTLRGREFELFLIGLFSVIDAILDRPMLEVLADLPLTEDVKGALMGKPEGMGRVLQLALAYEHAEWDRLPDLIQRIRIDPMEIPGIYRESIAWAEEIFTAADGRS
jgi:EAL and modified HD-GYP domain-containing signal transduction protein